MFKHGESMCGEQLVKVTDITLYTGTSGRKRCTGNCRFCTQADTERMFPEGPYQGNLEDIRKVLKALPNLKNAYILGNPDPSVDPEFCNEAAKLFIKNGCKVMFSTSGFGGRECMEKLLDGISPSNVSYVSISVDSLKPNVIRFLKGVLTPLETVEEAIKWCLERGYLVKIQPTLWDMNCNEVEEIVRYFFGNYGIKWFTFHFGSLETYHGSENHHVPAEDIRRLHDEIMKLAQDMGLNIKVPMSVLNTQEYAEYLSNYVPHCRKSIHEDIQVWLTSEGPKATFCPVLATVHPDKALFDLLTEGNPVLSCGQNNTGKCPVLNRTLGPNFDPKGYTTVCLYYKPERIIP